MSTQAIKTVRGHKFHGSGFVTKNQHLFSVTPGVDLADALNSISDLLSMIEEPICEAGMGEALKDNAAWRVHFILDSAKAAVDALWEAALEATEDEEIKQKEGA